MDSDQSINSSSSSSSSLSVELRLMRVRNICESTSREVFVRCYLSISSNKRVRIDTQQIPSNSNLNQTFSLNCFGNQQTIKSLKQGTIVFELRSRSRAHNLLARISGSKLLARAEMPWNDVVDDAKWVVMIAKNRPVYGDDVKPPAVEIAMKVEEIAEVKKKKKGSCGRRWDDDCGCMDCRSNYCHVDYDLFALSS